jgi:Cu/Ag efflux protein CusF
MATDPDLNEPPPKKSNTIWWILGCGGLLIIGLLVASPFVCCGTVTMWFKGEQAKQEKMVDDEAGIQVTAAEMTKAYADNVGTADAKYKNKVLVVTGKVTNVTADSVTLDPGNVEGKFLLGVTCSMADKNKGQLASIKTGDTVKVKGYCTGQGLLSWMSHCKIEK